MRGVDEIGNVAEDMMRRVGEHLQLIPALIEILARPMVDGAPARADAKNM
jgi:hypothetical protein